MIINVEHVDAAGAVTFHDIPVGLFKFIKHCAFVGQGNNKISNIPKGIGAVLYFGNYITWNPLSGLCLVAPQAANPTNTSFFSNMVGEAFADMIAKELLKVGFTSTYEEAMKSMNIPIVGSRPDLYCFSNFASYAIEAKGRSGKYISGNLISQAMSQAKNPANPLPVNFGYGAVSYDLFGLPKCKFYDPKISDAPIDKGAAMKIAIHFYKTNNLWVDSGRAEDVVINGRVFQTAKLNYKEYNLMLLKDKLIDARMRNADETILEGFDTIDNDNIYVDRDGFGIGFSV